MLDGISKNEKPAPTSFVDWRNKVLVLFGTRPEAIKLAPVIRALRQHHCQTIVVSSSQHREILKPFLKMLEIEVDFDLRVMKKNQTPNEVCARVMTKLDAVLENEHPTLVVVQGDTSTALAGALAAFNRNIPVAHVEAGLRSGSLKSPFPEEMNRRLISQIATFHFAATELNRRSLLSEGVPAEKVFVTGNTVIDSLHHIRAKLRPSAKIQQAIADTDGMKRILVTTHRRESFGETMSGNLKVLRDFVDKKKDVCVIFPVHPNPNVRDVTKEILDGHERIMLLEPLGYVDFVALMQEVWLIVSDSGGIQEEAPSLGKPLLILRENTERPEAVSAGVAKLVGGSPAKLRSMLEENYSIDRWLNSVKEVANPFGDGRAAERIATVIEDNFAVAAGGRRKPRRTY